MVTYAEVELVGTPTNPSDGEHVMSVELVSIDGAVDRLGVTNPFAAELLSFVAETRTTR